MPRYNTQDCTHNHQELDPCLAAKVRLKQGSCKGGYIWLTIVLLIALLFLISLLTFFLLSWNPQEFHRLPAYMPSSTLRPAVDLSAIKVHREPGSDEFYTDHEDMMPTFPDNLLPSVNIPDKKPVKSDVLPEAWTRGADTRLAPTQSNRVGEQPSQSKLYLSSSTHATLAEESPEFETKTEPVLLRRITPSVITVQEKYRPLISKTFTTTTTTTEATSTTSKSRRTTSTSLSTSAATTTTTSITTTIPPAKKVARTTSMAPRGVSTVQESSEDTVVLAVDSPFKPIKTLKVQQTCQEYLNAGETRSGVYRLKDVSLGEYYGLCLMEDDEAWLVLQQRNNGQERFWNRTFDEYADGFGDQEVEHWLGLEKIAALLKSNKSLELRIELWGDRCNKSADSAHYIGYYNFSITDRDSGYRLQVSPILRGNFSRMSSSNLHGANGAPFTTVDRDNKPSCANRRKLGAWWHSSSCSTDTPTLNGAYDLEKCGNWAGLQVYNRASSSRPLFYKPRATRLSVKVL